MCGEEKLQGDFRKNPKRKSGYTAECKQCLNAQATKWRKNNQEAAHAMDRIKYQKYKELNRSSGFKRHYGITIEEYDLMLEDQSGGCAICHGQSSDGRRLSVDHCHESGQVRGLLCNQCNYGLGQFRDRPDLLESAARYLRFIR